MVDCTTAVDMLRTVTATDGMAAPVESETVPATLPPSAAATGAQAARKKITTQADVSVFLI